MSTYERLIDVIDALHERAWVEDWPEAAELAHALGWPKDDGADGDPDGRWIRSRLREVMTGLRSVSR